MSATKLSVSEAISRASAKCAMSEQCSSDITESCLKWGLDANEASQVVSTLIKHKFIDDTRFAGAYARDKMRYQRWGKFKIRFMLKAKGIDSNTISNALATIDSSEYFNSLIALLNAKLRTINISDPYKLKASLARHAASRGFESELIFQAIDTIIDTNTTDQDFND